MLQVSYLAPLLAVLSKGCSRSCSTKPIADLCGDMQGSGHHRVQAGEGLGFAERAINEASQRTRKRLRAELHHGQGPGKYRRRLTPSAQDHLIFLTGHQAGIPSKTPLQNTKTANDLCTLAPDDHYTRTPLSIFVEVASWPRVATCAPWVVAYLVGDG
jgi:hypothetical protein